MLKAAQNVDHSDELRFVLEHYSNDFKSGLLIKVHLDLFTATLEHLLLTGHLSPYRMSLLTYAKTLTEAQKDLMSEVCLLLKLILVMPATNAVSERSFSALRRIKNHYDTVPIEQPYGFKHS